MRETIKEGEIEVRNALTEIGLTQEILREAILKGEYARGSCTANDPPGAPGFEAWAKTVRALREILLPKNWSRNDDNNLSTVVNPDGSFAIAVVTGDEGTGQVGAKPQTKYPKGPATIAVIDSNQYHFDFAADARLTWMLLRNRGKDSDTVFAELSLPQSMTEDGQVQEWNTRIILDPIDVEPSLVIQDDSSEPPIDVTVRRRS